MAVMHKRKPSRMVLSSDVAKRSPPRRNDGSRVKQPRNALSGLNRSVANVDPAGRRTAGKRALKGNGVARTSQYGRMPEPLHDALSVLDRTAPMKESSRRRPTGNRVSRNHEDVRPPPHGGLGRARKASADPFGGLNRTVANIDPAHQRVSGKRGFKGSESVLPKSKTKSKPQGQAFRALKMQRALAPVSYQRRTAVKERIVSQDSFESFKLLPIIRDSIGPQALRGRLDVAPSPIQRLAIPALLGTGKGRTRGDGTSKTQTFLLAAETGSGKTLAYLLPVIDALKRAEVQEEEQEVEERNAKQHALFELQAPIPDVSSSSAARPRAIILVPTAELVDQVGAVAKSLSHNVKFRAALLSANYSGQVIRNRLYSPGGVDLVISTPHLLTSIVNTDPNILARVTHLVIDEADSLLDRSFSPITKTILDRAAPTLKQLILCSATIPRKLDSVLEKLYPDTLRLTTPNLHAVPRRVQLSVVDIEGQPYHGNRNLACADTIWNLGKEAAGEANGTSERTLRVIVFVNERETTEAVAAFLRERGIEAVALNRDATDRQSSVTLAEFTGAPSANKKNLPDRADPAEQESLQRQKTARAPRAPNVKVLVMTDIGSRGIDTLEVRNVVLYDVPHTSIDFIHRLGRVGRMGRRGRGIVLVGKGDRRDIVREVRTGMFMGKALI